MFEKESSVQPKNPPVPSTSSSSSTAPPIHNEPVVPEPKFSNPPQSQSLLDFKMVHSPPASCVTLMETVQPHPLPAERLPAAKRLCTRGILYTSAFIIDCRPLFLSLIRGTSSSSKCDQRNGSFEAVWYPSFREEGRIRQIDNSRMLSW